MPKVTYVAHDGDARTIEVEAGLSLMQAAIGNGIDGIIAECGGSMSCATCHVFVEEAWLDRLAPPTPMEDGLLDCRDDRTKASRLACQIVLEDALDGIVVRLPESQF